MSATILVNNLTLSHKGSDGMSVATLPDVCLTPAPPAPPIPIPYPNIAINDDLVGGSTTVFADGGNSIATKGSHFSKSTGDEPGVAGGVMSGVNMKETSWLSFSMDVFIDGDNACRLTDKQAHNHFNAFNMSGQNEKWPAPKGVAEAQIRFLCKILCDCLANPNRGADGRALYQACVNEKLKKNANGEWVPGWNGGTQPSVTPGQGYDIPADGSPPVPRTDGGNGDRSPDSIIKKDPSKPPSQDNIELLVEMKFQHRGYCDVYTKQQQKRDKQIVGPGNEDKIVVLTPKNCGCPPDPTDPDHDDDPTNEGNDCQEDNTQPQGLGLGVEVFTALALMMAEAAVAIWEALGGGAGVQPGVEPTLPGDAPIGDPVPSEPPVSQPGSGPGSTPNPWELPPAAGQPGLGAPPPAM